MSNLELRLGFDYIKSTLSEVGEKLVSDGLGPLYTGFKIGVTEEKGLLPQIGFLGGIFLPFTASKSQKPEETFGEFRFAFSHTLSNSLDFSYNILVLP